MRLALTIALLLVGVGCEQRMANQPRYETLEVGAGQTLPPARETPPNSVPTDPLPGTGQVPERFTRADIQAGQAQFDIYCAPCHGLAGNGDGMVVQRGFPAPPNLHRPAQRNLTLGRLYQVITDGVGIMTSYANRLTPKQRWQTAAYVQVLQRSQHVPAAELSAAQRPQLGAGP